MTLHHLSVVAYLGILIGCFNPRPVPNLQCGPGDECPSGLTCGLDNMCHAVDATVIDLPSDGPVDSPPDAAPVACQSDMDCRTAPDICLNQGTCNLASFTCDFPPVDCSSKSDDCNLGVCDVTAGGCVARPRNEGNACGTGTVWGPFGVCGNFDGTCDASGTQTRTRTDHTCVVGACTETTRNESADCLRNTDGITCNTPTQSCDVCGGFADNCDNTGTQSCTSTSFTCQNETCTPSSTTVSVECTRNTNGTTCAPDTTSCTPCMWPSLCAETAPPQSCTCSSFTCQSGSCSQQDSSCPQPCSRETDGVRCGSCVACPPGEGRAPQECDAGQCVVGSCSACF
jgi:hypothetical protein